LRSHHRQPGKIHGRVDPEVAGRNPTLLVKIGIDDDVPARNAPNPDNLHFFVFRDVAIQTILKPWAVIATGKF
jgi:hypothetical protein